MGLDARKCKKVRKILVESRQKGFVGVGTENDARQQASK